MRPTTDEAPSLALALWIVALVLGFVVFIALAGASA